MSSENHKVMIDVAAKFHSYFHIEGWFHSPGDKLVDISFDQIKYSFIKKEIGHDYGGVLNSLGPGLGFKIGLAFVDLPDDYFPIEISFITKNGNVLKHSLGELINQRLKLSQSKKIGDTFHNELNLIAQTGRVPKILDIGGRNRSGVDRSLLFPNCDVVVLDILPGDNVDVVGDAHALSDFFPDEYFDAVYSVSVFEHLLMPWKVALEINKVLKEGGIGFVFTHQSLGMHDLPWDFYRFSDAAWDGLFNKSTGFMIQDRALDYTQYIIPFIIRPDKIDAEMSAGFEGSSVLFKKIGTSSLSWDVNTSSIIKTTYPNSTNGILGRVTKICKDLF